MHIVNQKPETRVHTDKSIAIRWDSDDWHIVRPGLAPVRTGLYADNDLDALGFTTYLLPSLYHWQDLFDTAGSNPEREAIRERIRDAGWPGVADTIGRDGGVS